MLTPELVNSNVVLTNSPGTHAPPMADHVLGMMLFLARRWRELLDDQRGHRWSAMKYMDGFVEMSGATVGILSLGDVGTEIARRAQGFGMEGYAVDKYPRPSTVVKEVWGLERLDELLEMSDWFVVTAPLTAETRGLIDRRRLGLLKESAYVIVISRGGIVDEDALLEALQSGRLAGAGLDTFAEEPLPEDSPFWRLDNVVITPHASANTPNLEVGRRKIFKENLRRYLANEPFIRVVDKKAGF
jgi:phosphoglycerate dehydrogenase-like enzyme